MEAPKGHHPALYILVSLVILAVFALVVTNNISAEPICTDCQLAHTVKNPGDFVEWTAPEAEEMCSIKIKAGVLKHTFTETGCWDYNEDGHNDYCAVIKGNYGSVTRKPEEEGKIPVCPQLNEVQFSTKICSVPFTDTPTATRPTSTPTDTEQPTWTPTSTNTKTPTPTDTKTPTDTSTPTITATATVTPTGTLTPTDTPTQTNTPTQTPTPTPTMTGTQPVPSDTPTPTSTRELTLATPEVLPQTGGGDRIWSLVQLALGGLACAAVLVILQVRKARG